MTEKEIEKMAEYIIRFVEEDFMDLSIDPMHKPIAYSQVLAKLKQVQQQTARDCAEIVKSHSDKDDKVRLACCYKMSNAIREKYNLNEVK